MTGAERRAELEGMSILEVDFGLLHARIEELVGRPVWTHEMGLAWAALLDEAESGECNEAAPFDSMPDNTISVVVPTA